MATRGVCTRSTRTVTRSARPCARRAPVRCSAAQATSASDVAARAAATAPRCVLTTLSPTSPTLGVSVYPDFFYGA
jgi:hypothetical protein